MRKINCFLLIVLTLTGCTRVARLDEVGDGPKLNPIKDPTKTAQYHPVTMPMPETLNERPQVNSLWRSGSRGFFKDQRAKAVGDILTVNVVIAGESMKLVGDQTTNRKTSLSGKASTFLGYEKYFPKAMPGTFNKDNLADISVNPTHTGHGDATRTADVNFTLAATIIQLLPNGNYVIKGRQELRAGNEVRDLMITGIVRPEDITSKNDISLDKIAEARMSYGGHGELTDTQGEPLSQRLYNLISPF